MSEVKPSREALTRREESFPPLLPLQGWMERYVLPANDFFDQSEQILADLARNYARANLAAQAGRMEELTDLYQVERRRAEHAVMEASRHKARADRLAEALRELVEVFSESGMYDEEVFAKARAALDQEGENG